MSNILYGENYNEAVENDLKSNYFLKADVARQKTDDIIKEMTNQKIQKTHQYIQTELEALIVQAINKGQYKITITPPSQYDKNEIIKNLTNENAGYTVFSLQNGAITISWENSTKEI